MKKSTILTNSIETPVTLEQYRSAPAGPHVDAFVGRLEEHGYEPRQTLHHNHPPRNEADDYGK